MEVSGVFPVFVCACFGGLLTELMKWYQLRESPNLPIYARSLLYWSITGLMVLASGALGVLYGTSQRNPIMVLNIGLSAPLIIRTLAETRIGPVTTETERLPPDRIEHPMPARPRAPGYRQDAQYRTRQRTQPAQADGPSIAAFLRWH